MRATNSQIEEQKHYHLLHSIEHYVIFNFLELRKRKTKVVTNVVQIFLYC